MCVELCFLQCWGWPCACWVSVLPLSQVPSSKISRCFKWVRDFGSGLCSVLSSATGKLMLKPTAETTIHPRHTRLQNKESYQGSDNRGVDSPERNNNTSHICIWWQTPKYVGPTLKEAWGETEESILMVNILTPFRNEQIHRAESQKDTAQINLLDILTAMD